MNNLKKYRRSWASIVCYALAAAMLIYVCYLIGTTVSAINQYYAQYQMEAKPSEYVTYILQQVLEPLVNTVLFFMLGYILDAIRKTDPANYLTDEELAEAKIARKEAREAKKFAKGEAAAAKAGREISEESSVEADFAKSLDEELKADEKQGQYKKSGGGQRRKQGGSRQNASKKRSESASGDAKDGGSKDGKNAGKDKKENNSGNKENKGSNRNGSGGNRRGGRKPAADKAKSEAKNEAKTEPENEVKFEAKVDTSDEA